MLVVATGWQCGLLICQHAIRRTSVYILGPSGANSPLILDQDVKTNVAKGWIIGFGLPPAIGPILGAASHEVFDAIISSSTGLETKPLTVSIILVFIEYVSTGTSLPNQRYLKYKQAIKPVQSYLHCRRLERRLIMVRSTVQKAWTNTTTSYSQTKPLNNHNDPGWRDSYCVGLRPLVIG